MYEEYLTLISEIKHHMDLYYNEDTPEISDAEYDALMRRLKQMEKEHPDWVSADSPTQIIGGTAKRKAGVIVTHNVPMLSIEDVFTKEDVTAWIDEVRAMHPDAVFVVEQKIDGLSMSLRYENGELILAETRGDGLQGEDVTANARVIPDVVQHLQTAYPYLEVRGEAYMSHADFERTNAAQEAAGKKIFANPRNCAAGTLRQLDAQMVRDRGLSFFVFNVQDVSEDARDALLTSHAVGLKILSDTEGMATAPSYVCKTVEEVLQAI
ncbi:MAG: NAD-dependent DNA ligase LigA, partial [Lachnospiraceae bacterium]|nr:NAD-dependent DNA ligase LigA [Lachnospiraceae bacterium]